MFQFSVFGFFRKTLLTLLNCIDSTTSSVVTEVYSRKMSGHLFRQRRGRSFFGEESIFKTSETTCAEGNHGLIYPDFQAKTNSHCLLCRLNHGSISGTISIRSRRSFAAGSPSNRKEPPPEPCGLPKSSDSASRICLIRILASVKWARV